MTEDRERQVFRLGNYGPSCWKEQGGQQVRGPLAGDGGKGGGAEFNLRLGYGPMRRVGERGRRRDASGARAGGEAVEPAT